MNVLEVCLRGEGLERFGDILEEDDCQNCCCDLRGLDAACDTAFIPSIGTTLLYLFNLEDVYK